MFAQSKKQANGQTLCTRVYVKVRKVQKQIDLSSYVPKSVRKPFNFFLKGQKLGLFLSFFSEGTYMKISQYAFECFKPLTENFATKVGMKIMASKPIKTIGPAYMHTDHE